MKPVVVQLPIGKEEAFEGVIDLVHMRAYRYDNEASSAPTSSREKFRRGDAV